jgi:CRP-like cAMP-binding protein
MNDIIQLSDKTITLNRSEFLCKQGQTDTNIYFIESGSVKVSINLGEEEQIIRFGYRGNLVVALDSLLTGLATQFDIQAIKKCKIKVISKKQLEAYLNTENNRLIWTEILEKLIVQQMEREVDLLTQSPLERYQRVIQRSPQLFQEIPNKYIANYLRMSAETLSRLKKY